MADLVPINVQHPRLMTYAEAARYLGRSRGFVETAVREGLLTPVRVGRRWYVGRTALDALAEPERLVPSAPERRVRRRR